MPELTMPRLSDTMQEGTLARWLKKPGDRVERGEIVAEIETDKATMELEAYDAGVLEKILVDEGQTVPIGKAIAVVGTGGAGERESGRAGERESGSGGDPGTAEATAAGESGAGRGSGVEPGAQVVEKPGQESTGDVSAERAGPGAPTQTARQPAAGGQQEQRPAQPEAAEARRSAPAEGEGDEVKASPMARAIARERGIDLHTVRGSGPGGRIIRADVEQAGGDGRAQPTEPAEQPAAAGSAPAPAPSSTAQRPPSDDVDEIPLTNIRKVVARRMLESVQSAPHFYLTSVVDAEALVRFRAELNERLAGRADDSKISLNDLLVKACATALRENLDINVSFAGDRILRHRRVNIGVAVALEAGLVVPVIRDADQKSLGQISREATALINKARAGKLTPDDYSGGTFTISNLGMFGIDHFTAVINPPEAAILAVGATTQEPVARDGQVVVRNTIKLTLSIDHRALDGATAARFLSQLKSILEDPLRIVV